jgi:hypothetical protein
MMYEMQHMTALERQARNRVIVLLRRESAPVSYAWLGRFFNRTPARVRQIQQNPGSV